MKNILLLVLSVFVLSSCLPKDDTPNTYSYWGVTTLDDTQELGYKVLLDNGQVVIPVTSDLDYEAQERQRILIFFEMQNGSTPEDDIMYGHVTYMSLYSIKDVIRQADTLGLDTLGTDPIAVYNGTVWHSNNFLNVPFAVDGDATYPKVHTVNLVYFPDSLATEAGGVYMELRHNANGDNNETVYEGFKSFDLSTIAPFANVEDSIPYTIKINAGTFSSAATIFEGVYYKPDVIR